MEMRVTMRQRCEDVRAIKQGDVVPTYLLWYSLTSLTV